MTLQDISTVEGFVASLVLPDSCRVDQRVPKKLLIENGAPTATDKRLINDEIEEIQWIAALKPTTIGIADYRDDVREYLEIAVLVVRLRPRNGKANRVTRLGELVHRAVPYPVILLLKSEQRVTLSLAHKRWAQNEAGKVVLDSDVVAVALPDDVPSATVLIEFTQALALMSQPQTTLLSLYQGWIDSAQALLAARLTGAFKIAGSPEQAAGRRQALRECERLELEATRLRSLAAKEKQLARRVELNLEMRNVQEKLAQARERL